MIVVDTSALMAVLLQEQHDQACRDVLARSDDLLISAATLAEALVVAEGRNVAGLMRELLDVIDAEIVPVTAVSAFRTVEAYRRWGKGNHPAGLNFGDCFAYELASARNCPLLFVGDDFARTDVASAIPR